MPDVQQVSFYSDGQLIGTANDAPYQMTWYQVPGTTPGNPHIVTATALVQGSDVLGGNSATFSSTGVSLNVVVEPALAAYQTSATDLQLPAPALPIAISRSYTSRSTDTNGILGAGWTAGWNVGSVTLSTDLSTEWSGVTQTGFASEEFNYISDNAGHQVMVNLPNGQSIGFAPQLQYDTSSIDTGYPSIVGYALPITVSFQPFAANSGVFSNSLDSLSLSDEFLDEFTTWDGASVSFESASLSQISYTAPDGTFYQFGQPGSAAFTWLLTSTTDRNGNSLVYTYDINDNVLSISNSCGRSASFSVSVR